MPEVNTIKKKRTFNHEVQQAGGMTPPAKDGGILLMYFAINHKQEGPSYAKGYHKKGLSVQAAYQ